MPLTLRLRLTVIFAILRLYPIAGIAKSWGGASRRLLLTE
jgi:hypothetical protein